MKSLFNIGLVLRRQVHRNAGLLENCQEVINRNPRNLELLRIARKPTGYHLEMPGREFWYKLVLVKGTRSICAKVIHHEKGTVVSASSEEWGLKKQLYRPTDSAAYINVGRVLAQRCLECGLYEMYCNLEGSEGEKVNLLLQGIKDMGIVLKEPPRYMAPNPWEKHRPEKPWEVLE